MNWYDFARKVYGLKDEGKENDWYNIVVPLGYGLLGSPKWDVDQYVELPDASFKTFTEALVIAEKKDSCSIVLANSDFLWRGCEKQEEGLKRDMRKLYGFSSERLISAGGANNSVSEAQVVRKALIKHGMNIDDKHFRILVICDWPHARSTRIIWKKVFPDSEICIKSVQGKWEKFHPAFLQKTEFRWLTANILRHLALIFLGIEWVAKVQHKVTIRT